MAIKISTKKETYTYIPISEREEKKPSSFIFKLLSKTEQAKLEDNIMKFDPQGQSITLANASYLLNAIKMSLKDIKNILDDEGKEIKLVIKDGMVTDDFIEMLPDSVLQELGNVIISVSKDPANADLYLGEV